MDVLVQSRKYARMGFLFSDLRFPIRIDVFLASK